MISYISIMDALPRNDAGRAPAICKWLFGGPPPGYRLVAK